MCDTDDDNDGKSVTEVDMGHFKREGQAFANRIFLRVILTSASSQDNCHVVTFCQQPKTL